MVLLQERYIFRLTNTKNTQSSGYLITSKTAFFYNNNQLHNYYTLAVSESVSTGLVLHTSDTVYQNWSLLIQLTFAHCCAVCVVLVVYLSLLTNIQYQEICFNKVAVLLGRSINVLRDSFTTYPLSPFYDVYVQYLQNRKSLKELRCYLSAGPALL